MTTPDRPSAAAIAQAFWEYAHIAFISPTQQAIIDRARELDATPPPRPADAGWRPIAEADRSFSGEPIDVWDGTERIADAFWGHATYDGKEPGWVVRDGYDCNGPVWSYVRPEPTHFMPLPAAPAPTAEEGDGNG